MAVLFVAATVAEFDADVAEGEEDLDHQLLADAATERDSESRLGRKCHVARHQLQQVDDDLKCHMTTLM